MFRDCLLRRLVDLSISESVPDHSTSWRFRKTLEKKNLLRELFDEVNDQLADKGLLMRAEEVSIIDAGVIEANQNRLMKDRYGNNTQGSDGKCKTTYGYGFTVHANVDEDGFIKTFAYTAGMVHDSQVFEELLTDHEKSVYADSAYRRSQYH